MSSGSAIARTSSASSTASTPPGPRQEPGGAVIYWHVDDIDVTLQRLLELGATEYEPLTERGESDFKTASVVDPFGNVLGVMYNPHYVELRERQTQPACTPT